MIEHPALVLLSLFSLSLTGAVEQLQKRVVERPFRVEGRSAAATFQELWSRSDVVIEGVIERDEPADYALRGTTLVHTMYDVRVVAIYKASKGAIVENSIIPVRRRGGLRDAGATIEAHVADSFPLFQVGERYVMFLRQTQWAQPSQYQGTYYYGTTHDGPDSYLRVEPAKLRTSSRSELAKAMAALSPDLLRAQLRRAAGGEK